MDIDYWDSFYSRESGLREESSFARMIDEFFPDKGFLLEFGCGAGEDSRFFASRGWDVFASDASSSAIHRADSLADRERFPGTLSFHQVDVSSSQMGEFLQQVKRDEVRAHQPLLIYTRFFLHSLTDSEMQMFVSSIKSLEGPLAVAHEFRILEDAHLQKVFGNHHRIFRDVGSVERVLVGELDAKLLFRAEGLGMARFRQEDPFVGRLIMLVE